jgi:hypothetical protein
VCVDDGNDVVAMTAAEAARTNASERNIKIFTANSEPTGGEAIGGLFRPDFVRWRKRFRGGSRAAIRPFLPPLNRY